ncbi:J domain-containing protein [Pseudoalteromonas viridis]|uniref:J domain-containing protein n=1 Tax=Pseudoalteromonas viridis TaxID=339617 RepID=A0ABX7VH07_9GAMM|nr:J domain-containing protein [Pseudoalteromonas viridis]QTL38193.1 J domain-containing protein [Pseudoalteromonas viridis]
MNNLKALSLPNSKQGSDQPSDPLQILWQRIEKHKKRNQNYKNKVAANYQQFCELVLPHEQRQIDFLCQQIMHLSSFVTRKSFTSSERDALMKWIMEDMDYLEVNPFADQSRVAELSQYIFEQLKTRQGQLAESVSEQQINALRAELQHEFGEWLTLSDEQLKACIADPAVLFEHIEAMQAARYEGEQTANEEADEEAFDDDPFANGFYNQFEPDDDAQYRDFAKVEQNRLDRLFKGSQLNKMYKRLASKLHPDKEPDPARKAQKHNLMHELSEARRAKDGFTILQLYLAHFDDDPEFDQTTRDNLIPLLEQKVRELNSEYRFLQDNHDIETLVWRQFKDTSKKRMRDKMLNHKAALEQECMAIETLLANCTTVKTMKAELKGHLKQPEFNPFLHLDELPDFLVK